ncbi:hypothetical protein D3C81_936180 [compost metagenome]
MAHRLARVQAQRAGRFVLALGDGLYAGTNDFGHVGAGEQRQCRHPGKLAGQVEHGTDEEVEDEDLYQQRCTAHQFDIHRRQVTQRRVAGQAAEAGEQADQQAQGTGYHRNPKCGPQAPGQRAGRPVAGDANLVAFGNIVAAGQLQAVLVHIEHLLGTALVFQRDTGIVARDDDVLHGAVTGGALCFLGLVGEVLRYAVPAPLVGNHRGGHVQAERQAHQDQGSQTVPGPLGFLVFDHVGYFRKCERAGFACASGS